MKLPEWLDQQVWHEIETIEESEKIVMSWGIRFKVNRYQQFGLALANYNFCTHIRPVYSKVVSLLCLRI
jgi:hypothetical protein